MATGTLSYNSIGRLNLTRLARRSFLTCLLCCVHSLSFSQQSNSLYLLHNITQSNQLNPAVRPACKLVVGIPLLNTIHAEAFNSSFNFNDIANGNELLFDDVYQKLNRMNMFGAEVLTYPFNIGYKYNNQYFTFSIADRVNSYNSYTKKLAGLLLFGNGPFIGETASFTNTRVNANYYREYAIGYAKSLDSYTSFGIRGKLLFGKAGLNTARSRAYLGTHEDTFVLTVLGDVRVNASLPLNLLMQDSVITNVEFVEPDYKRFFLNGRNPGLAADIGFIHRYSPDITFSASLLDLGMILWTDAPQNVKGEVDFLHEGVQNESDFTAATYFRDLTDSIYRDVFYTVSNKSYVSVLPPQLFLGATYHWNQDLDLGLVMRNAIINRRVVSSITASASTVLFHRVQLAGSWTYMNRSFLNVGATLAYVGKGLQCYVSSDNIVGIIKPLNARSASLRVGMNLMLGCPMRYRRYILEDKAMLPCPKGTRMQQFKNRRKNKRFLDGRK